MSPELPEHRTGTDHVGQIIQHLDYKLGQLHRLCEKKGLSPEVEESLRADLEKERELLSTLPPDSPLRGAAALETAHLERADARDVMVYGPTESQIQDQQT